MVRDPLSAWALIQNEYNLLYSDITFMFNRCMHMWNTSMSTFQEVERLALKTSTSLPGCSVVAGKQSLHSQMFAWLKAAIMSDTTEHAPCWPAVHMGALLSLHRAVSLSVFPPTSQCCDTSERALASLSHWYSVMPAPCWTPYRDSSARRRTQCVFYGEYY